MTDDPAWLKFARTLPLPADDETPIGGELTPEQLQLVELVIERAEQACRYALKHQTFSSDDVPGYRQGWEIAAQVCEGAIRGQVMRHIAEDLARVAGTKSAPAASAKSETDGGSAR